MPQRLLIILFLTANLLTVCIASTTLIAAKSYLDVRSGKMISPANILIDDGKIIAINPAHISNQVNILNKKNLILLPGLMDMHVHLVLETGYYPNYQLHYVQDDTAMSTMRAVQNAEKLINAGFTTIRCLGQFYRGSSYIDMAIERAANQHWVKAPHIFSAGNAIGMTGGGMDNESLAGFAPNILNSNYQMGIADGKDEIVKAVRYQIKYGAKVIKIGATHAVLSESDEVGIQEYTYEEMKAIVDEAHRQGVTVAAHAHGSDGIKAAIKAGVDSIEHGSLIDDEAISLMKLHHTYLVPTTYIADVIDTSKLTPSMKIKANLVFPIAKLNVSKAIKSGVKIAFGTDSPVIPHGDNAKEFSALVRRGMSPIEAIRSSTLNAAELLHIKDRGEIKVGQHADIIGVKEDPLTHIEILEHVSLVMKDGEIIKDKI